jgi:hypothetical protein
MDPVESRSYDKLPGRGRDVRLRDGRIDKEQTGVGLEP